MKKKDLPRRFIKDVQIHNYKGFKENQKIEFAPKVNLIFGKNSTGKSSIFQSIRLFRQSYASKGLTPINFEIPEDFKGKGGINLDINYPGVINELDIKKKLTLGIGTGLYPSSSEKLKIIEYTSLGYTYKYVKNFYTSNYLSKDIDSSIYIKDKTVLDSILIKKGAANYKIVCTKYNIFKEGSNLEKSLQKKISRRALFEKKNTEFKSIYPPYYYNVKVDSKSIPNSFLDGQYRLFSSINKESLEFLELISNYIEKKLKGKKLEDRLILNYSDIEKKAKKYEEFKKKQIKKENFTKERIMWMKKNYEEIAELFISSVLAERFDLQFTHYKVFQNDIQTLLNKFKNINKNNFKKLILSDFEKKTSCLIYFKGEFAMDPKMKKNDYCVNRNTESFLPFTFAESNFNYLYNIIQMTLNDSNLIYFFDPFSITRSKLSVKDDIDRCMNKMYIMPGLRTLPKKYYVKGLQTDYVGPQAENLAEFLANTKMRKTANEWLKKLEIPYEINVQKIDNYYSIVFKPNSSKSKISISQTHIGLGYPLIMPFVVQCIRSENQILLAEEPEVHLHPKLEADLADLIIWSANTRRNQFIIETHSEDFLLRLLKHVRRKKINSDEISANYIINKGKDGSKVKKVLINKHGQYSVNWKDNMFVERSEEFK